MDLRTCTVPEKQRLGSFDTLLRKLAERESGSNPRAVSPSGGHFGKYQFSPATLRFIGFPVSMVAFMDNERLQDSAVAKYMRVNARILDIDSSSYRDTVGSVEVTTSGILAAAHLGGAGAAKKWMVTNGRYNPADTLGTDLEDYARRFSGYKVEL